jgi:hypothetical protein
MTQTTTVTYHRTAIVNRYEDGGWDPYTGGHGGSMREFRVTEPVKSPDQRLISEVELIRITKVTTTTEVVG